MHFTLQQLKLFEAVSRNNSYTRAAEELNLTQPAVSIQIKRLEEQCGIPIFERLGKKIFTTTAGKALYSASVDILSRAEELKNTIEELKGVVKGPLRLSVVSTSKYFMPHLLGTFLTKYPEVEPKLVFTNRARVIKRLYDNEDDFVVMGQIPEDDKLETSPFLENILVPIAHPKHSLVKKKNVPLEELAKERFLVREEGSGTRLVFERLLKKNNLHIEPYMELGSGEALKQAVMAGLGLAILSSHSIRLEQAAKKLVVLDVEGFPIKRRWFAVHMKGKKLSLVAQTFHDFIIAESNNILDFKKE